MGEKKFAEEIFQWRIKKWDLFGNISSVLTESLETMRIEWKKNYSTENLWLQNTEYKFSSEDKFSVLIYLNVKKNPIETSTMRRETT